MPKRLMIILAITSLAIAACHSASVSTPPSAGPSISPTPNPKIKKATIQVTVLGTPAAGVPVEASTPRSTSSPRPGAPFATVTTGKKGFAHFTGLNPRKYYCWVAILAPGIRYSECASWALWQTSTIILGT